MAAAGACASCARWPTCPARSPKAEARGGARPSVTARSSSSRTSSTGATSRSRWWATVTARPRARRARLLHPAPSPEGGRGGAGARPRRRGRRGDARRRAPGRGGDRLPRRRHRRVPLRRRPRALLLPRDEHPPPGRAPGHRGRSSASTWWSCSSAWPRARACDRRSRRRLDQRPVAGTPSRCASTPRTRPTTGSRRAGCSPGSRSPRPWPEFDRSERPGIRVDTGFESGSEVSTYYDAMLAKVIAWAPTRREAARMLADALSRARLHGVVTNRDLLVAILRDEAFLDGQVSTDFFDRRAVVESTEPMPPDEHVLFAAAVALAEHDRLGRRVQAGVPVAWRNVVSQPQRTTFAVGRGGAPVDWYGGRDGYRSTDPAVRVLSASPERGRPRGGRCVGPLLRRRDTRTQVRCAVRYDDLCHGRRRTCVRASARGAPFRRSRRRGGQWVAAGADAGLGRQGGGRGRRRGRGGRARPRPRGDEDAAHDQRAHRRGRQRPRRRG